MTIGTGPRARDALDEIRRVASLDGAIRRRTSGITWMLWGIVAPGIFVTYALAGAMELPGRAFPLLWLPWTAAGVLATAALWRSAGLALRMEPAEGARVLVVHVALFLGLAFGGLLALAILDAPVREPAVVLGALGTACAGVGALGLAADRFERVLNVAAGAALVVVAVGASVALAGAPREVAYSALAVIAPVSAGIAFFGSGLVLVARG